MHSLNLELPSKPRILVVEDEKSLLELISSIIRASDQTCELVGTVSDALASIQSTEYDLVFLDLGLPDGSGFSILEHLVETNPKPVVTVITGEHHIETAIKAIRKGAFDYITKPFTVGLLNERLQTMVGEWKSRTFNTCYQTYLEKMVDDQAAGPVNSVSQIEHIYDMTVYALGAALDLRDPETEDHCRRVSENSVRLGLRLGVRGSELRDLKWGAYLHDIGKIGISENLLQKAERLTEEEMKLIQQHSYLGYSMLRNIDFLSGASVLVLQHHEKYDGSGYPLGLKGKAIHLFARIFAIVDAYDAMVFDRPYRNAMPLKEAASELRVCKGTHFDPTLVEAFLDTVNEIANFEEAAS
jgi:putative nucleotidyltransferase with HDIG domain